MSTINDLKFTYCFGIPEWKILDARKTKIYLEGFISKCLYLYGQYIRAERVGLSVIDEHTPVDFVDDVCILAAMALVHLDEVYASTADNKTVSAPYLLQAACVLEILLSNSPSNYSARLLLTRIQLVLGVGSLAMKS